VNTYVGALAVGGEHHGQAGEAPFGGLGLEDGVHGGLPMQRTRFSLARPRRTVFSYESATGWQLREVRSEHLRHSA